MFGERRKHQRHVINRVARFQADGGTLSRECTITDISESGARLFVSENEMPDKFYLLISGEKPIREECQVVWKLGGEVGVRFVTHERANARVDTMKRLRAEAQQIFRQTP
jgi:hypothetical protein